MCSLSSIILSAGQHHEFQVGISATKQPCEGRKVVVQVTLSLEVVHHLVGSKPRQSTYSYERLALYLTS